MSLIPGFLTLAEAAKAIGVSHAQASRYVRDAILEHKDLGNQYLIPESAVENFERPLRGNPQFRTKKNPAIRANQEKRRRK